MNNKDERTAAVADEIDDDIIACLKEMTEQIDELQELRTLVATARFLDMTEEEYHKLCETPLRNTDTLGMLLGKRLKFTFEKRTPSAFHYRSFDRTLIRIPNSKVHGAELVLSQVYKEDYHNESSYSSCKAWLEEVEKKISRIENDFFESNYFGKVMFTFGKKYRHNIIGYAFMFTEYTVKNLRKNYKKRYAEILEDLKGQKCKAELKMQKLETELKGRYEEQRKEIEDYCKQLFEWTDTVKIYQSESDYIVETIKRK